MNDPGKESRTQRGRALFISVLLMICTGLFANNSAWDWQGKINGYYKLSEDRGKADYVVRYTNTGIQSQSYELKFKLRFEVGNQEGSVILKADSHTIQSPEINPNQQAEFAIPPDWNWEAEIQKYKEIHSAIQVYIIIDLREPGNNKKIDSIKIEH